METVNLVEFKHSLFVGKPCIVDEEFVPYLNIMATYTKLYGFKIYITSSYRKDTNVSGAIVKPASMSNHLIGHAIDCNIIDEKGKLWNSKMLENPSKNIQEFIDKLKSGGLRWGGDFKVKDTVHFDDGLNVNNSELWVKKYDFIKNGTINNY